MSEFRAESPPVKRYTRAAVRLAFLLLAFFMLWQGVRHWSLVINVQAARFGDTAPESRFRDYLAFYTAGQLVREGRGGELYDLDAVTAIQSKLMGRPVEGSDLRPFLNPPYVALVFAPLTFLPLSIFSAIVCVIEVVLVVLGGLALAKLLRFGTAQLRLLFWLTYLSLFSTIWLVLQQQLSMVLFLGWFGFVWYQVKGHESHAGLSLAATLIKPQATLLAVGILVLKRRWDAVRSFSVALACLVVLSVVVSGLDVLFDYPRFLLQSAEDDLIHARSTFGWNGFLTTLTGDATPSLLLVAPLLLVTVALVVWAWRDDVDVTSSRFLLLMGLTLTASLLLNLHIHLQDLVLLGLAVSLGLAHALAESRGRLLWGGLVIVVWFVQLYGLRIQHEQGIPVLTILMAALMLLYVAALRHSKRDVIAYASPGSVSKEAASLAA